MDSGHSSESEKAAAAAFENPQQEPAGQSAGSVVRGFLEVEPLPLSALNHFTYCPRRCALIHIEGVFVENAFTLEGSQAHEHADTPGYENIAGVRTVRALPLFSRNLGLVGKADIVEFRAGVPYPVDYKRGQRKKWDNDDVQLCAQALCLEEMFQVVVPGGAIFHGASKRRRDVVFDGAIRNLTLETIKRVRSLLERREIPGAVLKPQCEGCSLHEICMPELAADSVKRASLDLFSVD
jgi:CRISPR-associated exonuclease Cas4